MAALVFRCFTEFTSTFSVADPDFHRLGTPTPDLFKKLFCSKIFAKNCMKMKEIGPRSTNDFTPDFIVLH